MRYAAMCAAVAVAMVAGPARAETRRASKGPYAEGGVGATMFVGSGSQFSGTGPSLALRGGYDIFSWFSVGLRADISMHSANVPPPPEGEYFQLYTGAAEGRLGINVWRLGIFADGSVGASYIST